MDHLNALIMTSKIRQKVLDLPELSIDSLIDVGDRRRAFIVLTFICHSFMIGVPGADPVISVLPRAVAVPWFNLATVFRLICNV